MNEGVLIEIIHGGDDAIFEFLFGRDADVAQDGVGEFGEETLDQVEPRAVFGREDEFETVRGLPRDPGFRLFGDMRRVIGEDHIDRRMGRIGGVEQRGEFDEFATTMLVLDQGVHLAREEVDAGQQTDRAVALVLAPAREGRMHSGFGRQVRGGGRDDLDAGLSS